MSFFKAYDMRGTFGVDFDLRTVYKVGKALPQVVTGKRWLVGRDARLSSDAVHDALVKGLVESGVEVSDLGRCTTSMLYFFTGEDDFDGSVMVTASHNPPSDNGLKVSRKFAQPVSYASGLKEVERKVVEESHNRTKELQTTPASTPTSTPTNYLLRYLEWQRMRNPKLEAINSKLRFAVDCSNGMASLLAKKLFPNAVILNDTPDGNFPAHSPNPLKVESRVELAKVVREQGLDAGVIFDGDADRAMFVDERGDFVQPDYLIPIVAKATGVVKGDKVLHDIRTSRGVIETLLEMGCQPIMVPVGPALAKPKMRELASPVGGELAGHYYFREFHCCDSGVLAALRVLGEIADAKAAGQTFSQMMAPIVSRYANSGELNYKVEDKDAAIERVLAAGSALGAETGRSTIDGIRVEFADGWYNVRKSNTEPYLRLLVECRTPAMLENWIARLQAAI